ncbi:cupin domain-containing protein [Nodosilinea sp. PGN35]|uniref:cupin domain-containing protein n=1 Tax=Nodosilinea sp. PGN35 TaxID=3020489 RepID=UPI0023B23E4C|nr:cupin domain-containing protein [Nodosilinea sp. TSF1-S3]MDF0366371.1 cupin domain-containing protein [Nodosilinea sp. TSF1-S3]
MESIVLDDLKAIALDPNLSWEPFRPGVDIHRLYPAEPDGAAAALLRYQPGATVPYHLHTGFEHILVLSGSQSDENGTYPAGSLMINPPGTRHTVHSPDGCVVLAIWARPVHIEP